MMNENEIGKIIVNAAVDVSSDICLILVSS